MLAAAHCVQGVSPDPVRVGHGRTRRGGPAGCSVIARTAGGWAREDSYNQR
jgi:hypothetical protein